jgi:NAD(P)H-quinone oxidoreductase subunit 4L
MSTTLPAREKAATPAGVAISLAYAAVAIVILVALSQGSLTIWLQSYGIAQMASVPEVYAFIAIIALAAFALLLPGSHQKSIIYIAGVMSFLALTMTQEMLIKYLSLAALLFAIGLSRNAVRVLMSIELMLNAVNINLVAFARYIDPVHVRGQIFAIFILTVAAAEAAVGLAIVLAMYRNSASVDMEKFNILKW